jgi:hypothetical protein
MAQESIRIGSRTFTPDELRRFIGVPLIWLPEAIASVALDHDDRAQTISLEELTPEQLEQWERQKRESTNDGHPETD